METRPDIFNRLLTDTAILEREQMDIDTTHQLERLLSRLAAVERYRIVRKYARGIVADAACGCGFGSWMLSKCPRVTSVVGFDRSGESLDFARSAYGGNYECVDLEASEFSDTLKHLAIETVVSVETIEHLVNPRLFIANVLCADVGRLVMTFPSFPTTVFNHYHLNDVTLVDMIEMVGREPVVDFILDDAVQFVVFDL